MELAFAQLPMVFFSTLVPMASGAFIGLAIAFLTTRFSEAMLARIDRWTLLPIGIMLVGFLAGIVFLVGPQNSVTALQGLDYGVLTLLGVFGLLLIVLTVVYFAVVSTRRLSYRGRTVFAFIVAACALAYSLGIAALYLMSAVITWISPLILFAFAGYCIAGGVPLGVLVLALAGGLPEARHSSFASVALILSFIGVAAAISAEAAQLLFAQSVFTSVAPGIDVVPGSWAYLIISIIGFIVMLACLRATVLPGGRSAAPVGRTAGATAAMPMGGVEEMTPVGVRSAVAVMVLGNAAVLIAILMARVLFYALQVL